MENFVLSQVNKILYAFPNVSTMKRSTVRFLMSLFVAITLARCAFAQTAEEEEQVFGGGKVFKVIVQTGLSLQWFDSQYRTFNLSAETQIGSYQHVGIQLSQYLSGYALYDGEIKKNSRELGIYGKFFLHGRLTGRKSKLYFGPELRRGIREYRISNSIFYPQPSTEEYFDYRLKVTKIMIRWGWQYHFENVVLELALPFGAEYTKSKSIYPNVSYPYDREEYSNFILMPTLQLGIGF